MRKQSRQLPFPENIHKLLIRIGIIAAVFSVSALPCAASVFQSGPEPGTESYDSYGPEPAPESDLTGEGMIGPSADSSGDSIFGKTEAEAFQDERMRELLPQVERSLPTGNGEWSVYICDLVSGAEGEIHEVPRQAASLIKLFIMGAVYERYDELTAQYGKDSIDANLYSMITVSDNDAANSLTACLGSGDSTAGMQAVNDFCAAHGFTCTNMGRLLLHSNEFGDNMTSAMDCGRFLKKIYLNDTEEFPHAEDMFGLLAAQTRRNKIPAQMPAEVSVANKTGELSDVENDAGIIYRTSNDLVVVFLSEYLAEPGSAQNTIASVSRAIYDYYNAGTKE